MSWAQQPLLGFDTETTGVNPTSDRIVTAALVYDDGAGGRQIRTWLLNPGVEIPEAAANVHGITTERAQREGQAPAPALAEIAGLLRQAFAAGTPVVAYNAAFDLTILQAELTRHQLPPLGSAADICPVIDPLVLDRELDRYRRGKRRLGDLVEFYGQQAAADLHDAEVDVLATLDVLREIARRYQQAAQMELSQLHTWQVAAHQKWARGFNQWRESKGLTGPGASDHWPIDPSVL